MGGGSLLMPGGNSELWLMSVSGVYMLPPADEEDCRPFVAALWMIWEKGGWREGYGVGFKHHGHVFDSNSAENALKSEREKEWKEP